jgi:hypothetical protein
MRLSAGTRLGPYEVLATLGEGGRGEVLHARATPLKHDASGAELMLVDHFR